MSVLLPTALCAKDDPSSRFDLSEGEAVATLKRFAAQAGQQILYSVDDVRGVTTQAVRGDFPPLVALENMVKGTPLRVRQDETTKAIAITRTKPQLEAEQPSSTPPRPASPKNSNEPNPKKSAPMKKNSLLAFLTGGLLVTGQVVAQSSTPAPLPNDGTIELSPFVVNANSQNGYMATQSLAGTRIKGDLKDIGSSLTVFTEEMMNDIGANSVRDLMSFAPNTDPFVMATSDVTGNGNDFININTKFVSRGGASTVISQDFFSSNVPQDRFNSEALTFSRGPNAILFGLGNTAGAFLSSTKRAKPKNVASFEAQVDDRSGYRATLDINRVLIKNRLSVRYAGLREGLESFRINDTSSQRRHFFTLNFTPFKQTTIRVNYERGHIQASGVRPWPDYDAVSPWLAAGSPRIATFTNTAGGKPPGTQNYAFTGLVSTEFSPAGVPIATQSLLNQGQTIPTSYTNGFPVNGADFRSFVNPSIYPTLASSFANTAYRLIDYHTLSAFWEQKITEDLYFELAGIQTNYKQRSLNGFIGQQSYLYVDPNEQLPNRQPNPNVGKLYSESQPTVIDSETISTNLRATVTYEFDFSRRTSGWLSSLGRHAAVVFIQQDDGSRYSSNNGLRNATPLATTGATASLNNGANVIRYRYYYDPAAGLVSPASGRFLETIPTIHANDPIVPNPSGITPAYINLGGPNGNESVLRTRGIATQSFFWQNQVVVTAGLRRDDQTAWDAVVADFNNLRDARGIYPSGKGIWIKQLVPDKRAERGGNTHSLGFVYHAFPWASVSYNQSSNFQVNNGVKNIYGDVLPNPQGKGSDYGLRFKLLDNRLFFDVTYYTIISENAFENITINPAGDFTLVTTIWNAIGNFTNDAKYSASPYSGNGFVKQDVVSTTGKGWEFSLTANPTKQWRVVLNGSKRGDNTTSPRGFYTNKYLDEYLPFISSVPEWQNLNVDGVPLSTAVTRLRTIQANFNAIRSFPSANFASNWTLNLIQSYELPRETTILGVPLKGVTIGGSMNARGKAINGFAETAGILDPTAPFYAPGYTNFGAWVTYKRKLFNNRVNWRLQMNVRNLFDRNTITPLVTVDSRDGNRTPSVAIYQLREPRTFLFTSSFEF